MKSQALEYKVENVKKYAQSAFEEYRNAHLDNSLNNARKACEAIARAIILKKMTARDGMKVILGEIDVDKRPKRRPKHGFEPPLLYSLLFYLDSKSWVDKPIYFRFQDIRFGGNNASHDAIFVKSEITEDDASLCLEQLKWILKWFWNKILKLPIPQNLINFSETEKLIVSPENNVIWDAFYQECNYFSNDQRFILITPFSFESLTGNELRVLSRIKWSMIFDFDSSTKETGFYKSVSAEFADQQIRPISIEEKDRKDEIISNSHYALNWFFANGLSSIPTTIAKGVREWRTTLKYSAFIRRLVKELINERVRSFTFIYLLNDVQYLQTIVQAIDENASNNRLIKHIMLYQDDVLFPKLQGEFEQYEMKLFNLPLSAVIAGINRSLNETANRKKNLLLQIPARSENSDEIYVDISNKYLSYLDKDIEVLHQGISTEKIESKVDGDFYKGKTISWKELAVDLDAGRSVLEETIELNQKWLDAAKGAYVVELSHKPGGGGTTLARRVAFKFHSKYPTILINKYHREKTNAAIFDLAEISKKPIFAIVEAYQVTQNELNSLVRRINEDKKHVVILYVSRSFGNQNRLKEYSKRIFLNDKTMDLNERNRFVSKYLQVSPESSKNSLKLLGEKNPHDCEIIDFVITAYQDEYSSEKVEDYVLHYLEKLPQNHLQFTGYAALIYYYTQNTTLDLWFDKLFSSGSLNSDYRSISEDEKYITKLFINEHDEVDEGTNYWRPRFSQFASEILKLVLVGLNRKSKNNWKDYLARWSVDLIRDCRSNHEYLTDDIREMFKSLFLNRDNEDVLGIDEAYDNSNVNDRKFASIIKHIADKEQQLSVFKCLVESFPEEAHFRGHLGRFMYEKSATPSEFDEAYDQISQALEIGDNDYNLWHIKGMCNRRKIEFLVRSDLASYNGDSLFELAELIQELSEGANEDFEKSRSYNPYNLHSHTAQIQMLIQVVDFGRKISNAKSREDFIASKENEWYESQLSEIFNLLDEAKYILELSRDLDQSKFIIKSKRMIESCEANLFGLIGDYSKAVDRFKALSEVADRSIRPYFRKMFVYATLASKVNNSHNRFREAWSKLSAFEFESLKKAIENNIREEPENSNHIKLWLQAVRFSKNYVSLEECFSTIKIWYDNSVKHEIAHLESTYYLYVIAASKAISENDSIDDRFINEAKKYLKECKEMKANDKFSFEWYGTNSGIKRLVSHSVLGKMSSEKRFFEDTSLLARVEGTITNIAERQKGRITLKCGLDAFFVPSSGGFEKDIDETTEVTFFVGFRQDGLFAWEVQRLAMNKSTTVSKPILQNVELENYDEDASITFDELVDEQLSDLELGDLNESVFRSETPTLEGVKVVGKIDISQFKRKKQ